MLHNFTQLFLTSWNLLLTILLLYRSFSKLNIYNFIFKLFFALCSCYPPNFKTQTHWLFLCYPLLYPSLSQYFIQWLGTQLILNIYLLTVLILKDCLIPTFFVSWNNFWFKVFCLILAYPLSFDYYLHRISFSIFLFSSSVSLDLKWISYKQHINVFYFKPILSISTF